REFGCSALGALRTRRKHSIRFRCEPGIRAGAGDEFDDLAIDIRIVQRLVAALTKKNRDGYAPNALAGDAPVRPGSDHVGGAIFAPGWIPFHFLDFLQSTATQCAAVQRSFHGDEPLLSGAEDDRI